MNPFTCCVLSIGDEVYFKIGNRTFSGLISSITPFDDDPVEAIPLIRLYDVEIDPPIREGRCTSFE